MKQTHNIIKYLSLLTIALLCACNNEDANDCIQSAGDIVREERLVNDFTKILVNEGISLVVKQGDEFKVEVESGENLLNDIETVVKENQLVLTNNNVCNFFRDYELTTIYVTAPIFTEIRSATQREIRSEGVIEGNQLKVYSEDYYNEEYLTNATIFLNVDVKDVQVLFNGISNIFMEGKATNLSINSISGNGRFEARSFITENADVYHRGSNDIIINVSNTLTGDIFDTGNIISVNTPKNVNIKEHYKGKLIYEN